MPLNDSYNRRIDYLRLSVTDRCNLSCVYCKPETCGFVPHGEILRYEEMLRFVTLAATLGITRVRVTGGEPLVRRGIVDFLAQLRLVPGLEDVSLTTNGVLLGEMANDLALHAGRPRLNISLDTLNAEKFQRITKHDAWNKVWTAIARAEELGFFPLKLNVVPVKGLNDDEIADFARLTLTRKLHVRFIEFMPIGASDRWSREACVTSADVRSAIEREVGPLVPFDAPPSAGPATLFQLPGAQGVIGLISPITRHFCDSCRRLRLTADGRIRPCLLSDTEVDIKTALRSGCSDEELGRLIQQALAIKPERHHIGDAKTIRFNRTMSKIGG
jgi:cyclic pyranopterin phosphate synthase